ncbi:MAG: hypothetical protein CL920_14775 [Deltaproteobacteria bacterium]|nr:hypothetical protein [Deltaproteobacteria bacterium]MBU49949.1 hypothetical protein [Deltaproteobacteria bacterium]|tara:strand:- start:14772 stop:16001 length:1230 start_codon:yes stop_codon:yes gene_type:complete
MYRPNLLLIVVFLSLPLFHCTGPISEPASEIASESSTNDGGNTDLSSEKDTVKESTAPDASMTDTEPIQEAQPTEAPKETQPEETKEVELGPITKIIATNVDAAEVLYAHKQYLYWFERFGFSSLTRIFRIPLSGGAKQKIAEIKTGHLLTAFDFSDTTLYYVESKQQDPKQEKRYKNTVYAIELSTLSSKTVATYENGRQIGSGFLVHNDAIYWSNHFPRVAPTFKRTSEIWRTDLKDGTSKKLASTEGWAQDFVIHGTYLYWLGAGLRRMPLVGGTVESTEWSGGHRVWLRTDGFWGVVTSGELGDVLAYNMKSFGEKPTTIYYGKGHPLPKSEVRDQQGMYYIDSFTYDCRVCYIPFAGPHKPSSPKNIPFNGKEETSDFNKITAITLTQHYIYWYSNHQIGRTQK